MSLAGHHTCHMPTEVETVVYALARTLVEFTRGCSDITLRTMALSEYEHVQEARTAFLLLAGHARSLHC